MTLLSGRAIEHRVDRGFYHHHALYVGNGAVIQFGGRIKDKPHASIDYHPLPTSAKALGSTCWGARRIGSCRCRQAGHKWLVEHPPPTTYHLLGYNCEHVARLAWRQQESNAAKRRRAYGELIYGWRPIHVCRTSPTMAFRAVSVARRTHSSHGFRAALTELRVHTSALAGTTKPWTTTPYAHTRNDRVRAFLICVHHATPRAKMKAAATIAFQTAHLH